MTSYRTARIHLRGGPRDGAVLEMSADRAGALVEHDIRVEVRREHRPAADRLTEADLHIADDLDIGTVDLYRLDRVTLSPALRADEVTMRANYDGVHSE